jgi:hypothetical protein
MIRNTLRPSQPDIIGCAARIMLRKAVRSANEGEMIR